MPGIEHELFSIALLSSLALACIGAGVVGLRRNALADQGVRTGFHLKPSNQADCPSAVTALACPCGASAIGNRLV